MSYDPNNIFARILRGELPCVRIYEDEHTLSFMDIMPQTPGHCLVIPKEAAVTLLELSPASAAATIQTVQKVARAAQRALDTAGLVVFQLNGTAAGQTVPHIHFHILPGGGIGRLAPHAREPGDMEEIQACAEKIRAALALEPST